MHKYMSYNLLLTSMWSLNYIPAYVYIHTYALYTN